MVSNEPGYIVLYRTGELEQRAESLEARLASCDICPRECRIDRLKDETGYCHSGRLPIVSSVCAHHGEEPALSGIRGSGTVFFGNCNMRCVYCQNYQISQDWRSQQSLQIDCHTLAEKLVYLQDKLGCHNINFVSPSHFVPQMVRAVVEAVQMGLRVPLVYNTGSYDSVASLRELDGIVSVYLADLRYNSEAAAKKYSKAPGYVARAHEGVKEMYRQVGDLQVDESGVAQRGLIVRLLILPNGLAGTEESLSWLARELSPTVTVSLMSQYSPQHKARQIPLLSRTISATEYRAAVQCLEELGMDNGWVQEMGASECYVPDFERKGHPFVSTP
jgi:putative pyruvate formate lyase activating enzyme